MGQFMSDYLKIKQFLSEKPKSEQEAIEKYDLERAITSVREQRLEINPILGSYDFEHIAKIHQYLFSQIHDFAGQLRQREPFYKQSQYDLSIATIFANVAEIIPTIQAVSEFLQANNYLKNLNRDDFLYEFSVSYAEFNFAHPFEEGNGRATRILFKQLAKEAGYRFDIHNIDKKQWELASIYSCYHGKLYDNGDGSFEIEPYDESHIDIYQLIDVMDKCLVKIN